MHKTIRIKYALWIFCLLTGCASVVSGASNYLMNAGFEAAGSSADKAAYWERGTPDNLGRSPGNVTRQSWRARSGTWEGTINGSWWNAECDCGFLERDIPVKGGKTYTFSGWFWSDDNPGNIFTATCSGMRIYYYTNSPVYENLIDFDDLYFDRIGSIWTYREISLKAPEETDWAMVEIFAWGTGNDGALQFDDLFFGEKEAASLSNPGPMCRRTPLVVSEIMYHPEDGWPEFVEIYNSEPFSHDLSGYQLTGDIEFTFPEGCVAGPTGYLVVAASPDAMQSMYGLSDTLGPYSNELSNGGGELKLLNELGAVLMTIEYDDNVPWPPEADGLGYALVPDEGSFGPNDVRSWKGGCYRGGSPGQVDSVCTDAVMSVVINEVLTHTDHPLSDFLELYNRSDSSIDLGGCILTDSKTNDVFVIPSGTVIGPYSFLAFNTNALHFNLSSYGETVYFKNAGGTGVIDVIEFPGLPNGVSYGRFPDGGSLCGMLQYRTENAPNSVFERGNIVINEIMYHPASGDERDEYIELHNCGDTAVDVSGWRLRGGIDFVFQQETEIAAGDYLVVAKNKAHLIAVYDHLNAQNTAGDYIGKLSDHSAHIILEALDDPMDPLQAWVIMDEVTYYDGGCWGQWSDGGGSSLELIDPRADNRLPSNWADSDETGKGTWVTNSITRILTNGMLASGADISQVQLFMLRKGECLVDEVWITTNRENNLVINYNFENGSEYWTKRGNHKYSETTHFSATSGSHSERIRATGGGDTKGNGLTGELTTNLSEGDLVTMSFKARWMCGEPYVHIRLLGGFLCQTIQLPLPQNLGTPGLQNSCYEENTGPAITAVSHFPILPGTFEPVTVTARVDDPDGVLDVYLHYRDDPDTNMMVQLMYPDNKGNYSTRIYGYSVGSVSTFHIEARDYERNTTKYPANAPASECLIRFSESDAGDTLGTYHIITTENTMNTWSNRSSLDNELLDCTFISGNRVIYGAGIRYRGSPFLRRTEKWVNDPANASAAYRLEFPADDPFLGSTEINLDWQEEGRDTTYQREKTAFWMAGQVGLPAINQRYVVVYLNGKKRGVIYTDSQHVDSDYIASWYPKRPTGDLHKINDWVEYDEQMDQWSFAQNDANLVDYRANGMRDVERYRWNWERKKCGTYDLNNSGIMTLVDAANMTYKKTEAMEAVIDVRQWMKTIALRHVVDDWDSFGFDRGKNMFAYRPQEGKWDLLIWDMDFGFGAGSDNGPDHDVFKVNASAMPRMYEFIHGNFTFRRYYWQAIQEIVEGPMSDPALNAGIIEVQNLLQGCGLRDLYGKTELMNWIAERREYLLEELNAVTGIELEAIDSFSSDSNNTVFLYGTAPIQVNKIKANGVPCRISWFGDLVWMLEVTVTNTSQAITLQGYDQDGQAIPGMSDTYECEAAVIDEERPEDNLVINEIMYHPAPGGVAYIEIYNKASNTVYDLYNYRLKGVDITFKEQALIKPGNYLVIAADRQRYIDLYGVTNIPAANWKGTLSNAGETLQLVRINGEGQEELVDEVIYSDELPWPEAADGWGASLQLIDYVEDNNRVGNWKTDATVKATPNAQNSVEDDLPAFASCVLNEIQPFNQSTLQDSAGDYDPWLELYNETDGPLVLTNYYLTDDYTHLDKWAFGGMPVLSNGFVTVWVDGEGDENTPEERHTSFSLSKNGGSLAFVHNSNGRLIIVDYMNYQDVPCDRSYGDFADGIRTNRMYFANATPGCSNDGIPMLAMIVINEWLADNENILEDPQEPGKYEDWFELYNAGQVDVDLGGYTLTDDPEDPSQWVIPTNTVLPAGSYRLVWADDDAGQNMGGTNDLHANFKLSAEGEYIGLFNTEGARVDSVAFGPQVADISEGCFPDAQRPFITFSTPTPYARNLISTNVYIITVSAANHGSIMPGGNVEVIHGYGQVFDITAERYYVIDKVLTNGTPEESICETNTCSLTLPFVTSDISLEASFQPRVSTNGTPLWWLAQYGLTNSSADEEDAEDTDLDGYSAAEEYIAGTVPVSNASFFKISDMAPASNGYPVLKWSPAISGRVYIVRRKTDLAEPGYQTITNLHHPSTCYTIQTHNASAFYQIGVELESETK